jgi:hypothetical protein
VTDAKIFSPGQIALATFLGGPLAATNMLRSNFRTVGDREGARKAALTGWLFTLLLISILPFLPKHFPNIVIPVAYTAAVRQYALQYKDKFIGEKWSNGKVALIVVLSFLLFLVLAVPYLVVLDFLGYTAAN